jgi:hypothetical protein
MFFIGDQIPTSEVYKEPPLFGFGGKVRFFYRIFKKASPTMFDQSNYSMGSLINALILIKDYTLMFFFVAGIIGFIWTIFRKTTREIKLAEFISSLLLNLLLIAAAYLLSGSKILAMLGTFDIRKINWI